MEIKKTDTSHAGPSVVQHRAWSRRFQRILTVCISSFILLAAGVGVYWNAFRSEGLSPQEQRGKQIFFEGTSPGGGKIKAFIGHDQIELPGSAATCSSCHGPDGRGRPEAGVIPSDITWDNLMKRYGMFHAGGRKRPAFTEATLKRAILTGYDSGGNRLDRSMPTYSMSPEDINALVAYMKRLKSDLDPGITDSSVKIGTVLPEKGPMGEIGQGMFEVISTYFKDINAHGGIHNRRLELVRERLDDKTPTTLAGIGNLLQKERVFALLGVATMGEDLEIVQLVEERGVPFIGPFTLSSPDPFALNEHTFYLYAGLTEQAMVLVDFAAQQLDSGNRRMALMDWRGQIDNALQEALETRCETHGWTLINPTALSAGPMGLRSILRKLRDEGTDVLFVLGPGDLKGVLEEAGRMGWEPHVLMSGAHVTKEMLGLPPRFAEKIFIAYPALPLDQTPAGMAEFQQLLDKYAVPLNHGASQVFAYVAAKVLVEGLKGAGKELSREKFIRSLERLNGFDTGMIPPITYGPNRRIGVLGSHIVTLDVEKGAFVPVGNWRALSDS